MADKPTPAADAKIGAKIDWIAATLHEGVLKATGFRKQARTFWRESGSGAEQVRVVLNLQGNKWNEGSKGSFCVNLGVHFPAITRELAALEEETHLRDWWLAQADSRDEASCTIRLRLPDVLPEALPQPLPGDWPQGLRHDIDYWFPIDPHRDLARTATWVQRLVAEHALPWFERNADLAAFVDGGVAARGNPRVARCFGAFLLGRFEQARALAREAAGDPQLPPSDYQRRLRLRWRALGLLEPDA
jgi:hypothetical protein